MTAVESLKREVEEDRDAPEPARVTAPVMVNPGPVAADAAVNPESADIDDTVSTRPISDGATLSVPEGKRDDDVAEIETAATESAGAAIDAESPPQPPLPPDDAPPVEVAPVEVPIDVPSAAPGNDEAGDVARSTWGFRSAVVIPLPVVGMRARRTETPEPAEPDVEDAPEPEETEPSVDADHTAEFAALEMDVTEADTAEVGGAGMATAPPSEPPTENPTGEIAEPEDAGTIGIADTASHEATPTATEPAATEPAATEPAATEPAATERDEEERGRGEAFGGAERADDDDGEEPLDGTPAETARARLATLFVVPTVDGKAEEEPPSPLPRVPTPTVTRLRAATNPLLTAAAPVLEQIRLLRDAEAPDDAEALGFELTRLLARYEEDANRADLGPGAIQVGRFALAATLDDVLRTRPWAGDCGWLRQGLAASGPERFFDLMRVMLNKPARHQAPLELFYACLSLGFEGRFRDKPRGVHDLNRIRDQLHRVLRRLGEPADRALSPGLPPPPPPGGARYRPPPPLVSPRAVALWLGALCLAFHFIGAWWLNGLSAPVALRLAETLPEREVATARPTALPPMAGPELPTRIAAALSDDMRAGAVEMLAGTDGALVLRLSGGAVFPAGSDGVRAFYRAVIDRVGKTLAGEEGRIVVVAHTDSWALATERFPSPRALTEARAEAVRALLERHLGGIRLSAEGRGDGEPIDTNDTPAGRAANRRIEIRLYP